MESIEDENIDKNMSMNNQDYMSEEEEIFGKNKIKEDMVNVVSLNCEYFMEMNFRSTSKIIKIPDFHFHFELFFKKNW